MNELIKLNKARQALMEAKTLQEIREIKDIAKAVKAYAQAKKLGVEMINDATEIELRAEREMGKLIQQKQEAGELAKHGDFQGNQWLVPDRNEPKSTLSEIGISKKESMNSKRLAAIPEEKFEQKISELKSEKKPLTKTGFLKEIAFEKKFKEEASPFADWSDEEKKLISEWQSGKTIVINMERHTNLVKYAYNKQILTLIDRTTEWGNPFILNADGNRDEVCDWYRDYYLPHKRSLLNKIKTLRGKILGCHCHPLRCHGDILKHLADESD